jgi:hypothetical protein
MNDDNQNAESNEKGKWVPYGGFHFYSVAFGFLAGCAVSFLFIALRAFG